MEFQIPEHLLWTSNAQIWCKIFGVPCKHTWSRRRTGRNNPLVIRTSCADSNKVPHCIPPCLACLARRGEMVALLQLSWTGDWRVPGRRRWSWGCTLVSVWGRLLWAGGCWGGRMGEALRESKVWFGLRFFQSSVVLKVACCYNSCTN